MATYTYQQRILLVILLFLLGLLQYRIWFGKNSIPDLWHKEQELAKRQTQNSQLTQRNTLLEADIDDLKLGLEAIEERARNELGLIKQGETFYRILPQSVPATTQLSDVADE